MANHPNTTAAGLTTGATLLLVWLLHSLHVELSLYYAGLIVGGGVAAILFIGRRGLKGTLQAIWKGTGTIWTGQKKAAK